MSNIVSAQEAQTFLGARPERQQEVQLVLTAAQAIVSQLTNGRSVPDGVLREAELAVLGDLWHLRQAPNGVKAMQGLDGGTAIHVSRDATLRARGILGPYLMIGLA